MKKFIYLTLICFFLAPCKSYSLDTDNATTIINYKEINKQLDDIKNGLLKKDVKTKDTTDYLKKLNEIENQISDIKKQDETDLEFLLKKIEALGELPKDGVKEDYTISLKRKDFSKDELKIKTKMTENDLILAKIEELEKLISTTRNKILLNNILDKQIEIVSPKNFITNSSNFLKFLKDISKSIVNFCKDLKDNKTTKDNLLAISSIVFLSLLISTLLSIFIKRYFGYKETDKIPDYGKKFFAGIATLIAYGVIPSSIIWGFTLWIKRLNIKDGLFLIAVNQFLIYLFYIIIAKAIAKVIFVPENEKWRLINFSNPKAKSLNLTTSISIFLIAIILFFEKVSIKAEYSMNLILYIKLVSCIIKVICIILITNRLFKNEEEIKNNDNNSENDDDYGDLTIFDKIKLTIYFLAFVVIIILFLGFINLSNFILNHSIITVLVVSFAYIFSNTIQVLFRKILLLSFWVKILKIKRKSLAKLNIWFGILINPIIALFTIFVILGLWGVSTDLLIQNIKKFMTSFTIGGIKISITSILLGILVYIISMFIFKFIKVNILSNTFEKMDIDESARDSLASGFSFFGFIVSVFFAIAVMGGSVSNLAIIAGALSFGVGLGLQNIVSNFVSGVIILFERPIKIGDIVNINGQEGTVRQINIRSTEIETGLKSTVIIPNANIMSNIVINMTHNNKQARIDLKFLLDLNNNPKEIIDILLETAVNNKRILQKPQPSVAFNDFLNNGLDFTLNCYIADISNKQGIINELRIEIFNKFNKNNIKVSVPQQIVYINKQ